MKKIAIALLALLSTSASAKVLTGTQHEIEVDPVVYERVFANCLGTFKVDAKKDAESLTDLIEACRVSAQKIAAKSEYVGKDDKFYVTIKPKAPPKVAGDEIKQINPVK